MSEFSVKVVRIEQLLNIEGADVIELAKVNDCGYQFVVKKGDFQIGDLAVYFPLDALIPQWILEKMGLWKDDKGLLSGSDGNRVKTIKLRGQISQGLLASQNVFDAKLVFDADLTQILGVEKYEPVPIFSKGANLRKLSPELSKYDIENAEKYPHVLDKLRLVVITEKLEGSNFSYLLRKDGSTALCSRNYVLTDYQDNHIWALALKSEGIHDKLQAVLDANHSEFVALQGEIVGTGIQGNIYHLNEHRVYAFDIIADGQYIDALDFRSFCDTYSIRQVPHLHTGYLDEFLNGETLQGASNGNSLICPTLREGIVVKPFIESWHSDIGRLILKQRDPIYLSKQK